MPIEVRDVRAFEGPNLYYPQTGVKLTIWSDRDIGRQISDTLKTWAQMTGVVIGYLRQQREPDQDGMLITTTWTTPLPTVGAQIAHQIAADLAAAEQKDADYDHDEALFAIIAERKRQEPSLPLLQMYAEAHARDLPIRRRGDGQIMIGSGARGWSFDPAPLSLGMSVDVPWDSIGAVPLVAVTGPDAAAVTRCIATLVERQGHRAGRAASDGVTIVGTQITPEPSATVEGARRVLTDDRVDIAIVEVSMASVLEQGLGFDQCRVGVVTGVEATPGEAAVPQRDQIAAHGIVVLATEQTGVVVLNADDPHAADLREWTSGELVLYSNAPSMAERVLDGNIARIVYRDGSHVYVMDENQRVNLGALNTEGHTPAHMLPAAAAVHALGIDITIPPASS